MKLSSASTLLVSSMVTASRTADAWSGCGPGGYGGVFVRPNFGTLTETMIAPNEVRRRLRDERVNWLRQQQELFDRANPRKSVRYQILGTDNEFKVALDVPGVLVEDIDVAIEEDGKVLAISGEREKMGESGTYRVQFGQKFFLDDDTIDIEKFSANLKNGVLVVTAPKEIQRVQERIRKIPVISEEDENNASDSSTNIDKKQDNDTSASSIDESDTDDGIAKTDSTGGDLNDK